MKHKLRKFIGIILTLCMIIPTLATGAVADNAPFSDIAGHWAEDIITRWADVGIVNGYPDGTFKPDESITRAELAKIVTLAFGLTEPTEQSFPDLNVDAWYFKYVNLAADYINCLPMPLMPDEYDYYIDNNKGEIISFYPDKPTLRYQAAEALSIMKIIHDGGYEAEYPEDWEPFSTVILPHTNITITFPSTFVIHPLIKEKYSDEDLGSHVMVVGDKHLQAASYQERGLRYIWLADELGIMQGEQHSDGMYFLPFDSLTRAEVLTIIDRILTPEQAAENMLAAEAALDKPEPEPEPVEVILPDGTVPESIDLADSKYNITMTRAQFAELLTVAFDLDGETSLALDDVDPNSEYYSYIKTAADYIPKFTGYEMRAEVDAYYQAQNQSRYGDFLPDETILRMHASQAFTDIYELLYGVEFPISDDAYETAGVISAYYADPSITSVGGFLNPMMRPGFIAGNVLQFQNAIYTGHILGIMNDRIGTDGKTYFLPYDALTLSDALYSIFKLLPADDAEVFVSELDGLSFMQAK